MKTKFIRSAKKKEITKQINEDYGISKIPHLLIESGKEKIRGFTGHLSKDEIISLSHTINIESIGIYLFKKEHNGQIRLSLDACNIFKEQIKSKIVEINRDELAQWLHGEDLPKETQEGYVFIKYNDDLIGMGMSNKKKIYNHLPKSRRLKN